MFDTLGTRMKENYESISKTRLVRRMPVIIRIDGKAFHTYTRGMEKPFDSILITAMQNTMKFLCENVQGCVLGYHQSDEISLLLIDYKRFNSCAWFDNEVQKICSISASFATGFFNQEIKRLISNLTEEEFKALQQPVSEIYQDILDLKLAFFDARCFNVPKEEVTNYFYWREQDAIRNSVQMLGQFYFSHKELHKKSSSDIVQMLKDQKQVDFYNDLPLSRQRGTCCIKNSAWINWDSNGTGEIDDNLDPWVLVDSIPIFKGDGRELIEQLLMPEEG